MRTLNSYEYQVCLTVAIQLRGLEPRLVQALFDEYHDASKFTRVGRKIVTELLADQHSKLSDAVRQQRDVWVSSKLGHVT